MAIFRRYHHDLMSDYLKMDENEIAFAEGIQKFMERTKSNEEYLHLLKKDEDMFETNRYTYDTARVMFDGAFVGTTQAITINAARADVGRGPVEYAELGTAGAMARAFDTLAIDAAIARHEEPVITQERFNELLERHRE